MTRLRLNPHDGIHHVNNHVLGDGNLFLDDRDRRVFLRLMERARKEYEVAILSYCLMGNHYHAVARCPEANLHRFMQHFQSRYALYFNRRHGRRGALFMRRYHNELITTDGQLQFALRYVDRNPLELGIDIATYPWGSYAFYSGFRSGRDELVTIDSRWVRSFAGSTASYVALVEEDLPHDQFKSSEGTRRIRVRPTVDDAESLHDLAHIVAEITGQGVEQVVQSTRGKTNEARLAAFLVASESDVASSAVRTELGCHARSTFVSTVERARRRRDESTKFAALVDEVSSRWRPAA